MMMMLIMMMMRVMTRRVIHIYDDFNGKVDNDRGQMHKLGRKPKGNFCGGSLVSPNHVDDYDDYMMTV